jgi:hypothetical protein
MTMASHELEALERQQRRTGQQAHRVLQRQCLQWRLAEALLGDGAEGHAQQGAEGVAGARGGKAR